LFFYRGLLIFRTLTLKTGRQKLQDAMLI